MNESKTEARQWFEENTRVEKWDDEIVIALLTDYATYHTGKLLALAERSDFYK